MQSKPSFNASRLPNQAFDRTRNTAPVNLVVRRRLPPVSRDPVRSGNPRTLRPDNRARRGVEDGVHSGAVRDAGGVPPAPNHALALRCAHRKSSAFMFTSFVSDIPTPCGASTRRNGCRTPVRCPIGCCPVCRNDRFRRASAVWVPRRGEPGTGGEEPRS